VHQENFTFLFREAEKSPKLSAERTEALLLERQFDPTGSS
jgi:hypothetical protein